MPGKVRDCWGSLRPPSRLVPKLSSGPGLGDLASAGSVQETKLGRGRGLGLTVSRWTKEKGEEGDFGASGPPSHKAVKGIWLLCPLKKPQRLNLRNSRSPLSVAGPGQGQGTREAGGEGLRAGCAKARVKFKISLGRTGKEGELTPCHSRHGRIPGLAVGEASLPEGLGLSLLSHDLRFGQREAA